MSASTKRPATPTVVTPRQAQQRLQRCFDEALVRLDSLIMEAKRNGNVLIFSIRPSLNPIARRQKSAEVCALYVRWFQRLPDLLQIYMRPQDFHSQTFRHLERWVRWVEQVEIPAIHAGLRAGKHHGLPLPKPPRR